MVQLLWILRLPYIESKAERIAGAEVVVGLLNDHLARLPARRISTCKSSKGREWQLPASNPKYQVIEEGICLCEN